MLSLKGETRVEYFHVECDACGHYVILRNLRWVGGVPQIEATCKECNESGDFKLHPPTWLTIVSGEG
jgi:DnaJ-class molecular chaperone